MPGAPVGMLHLHEEVGQARHDEQHHERLQAPPDELRAQDENLPADRVIVVLVCWFSKYVVLVCRLSKAVVVALVCWFSKARRLSHV